MENFSDLPKERKVVYNLKIMAPSQELVIKGFIMKLLREYYELCEGGVCQDLLTEDEKRFVSNGGMMLSGKLQEADVQNGNGMSTPTRYWQEK